MKFKKYLIIVLIFSGFLLFGTASLVATAEAPKGILNPTSVKTLDMQTGAFATGGLLDSPDASSLSKLAASIIAALLSLLGLIFLGLIIYAGYNWMTAGGEEEKIKKSTDTIKRALIGLIITLSAYAITYFVFNNFFSGQFSGGTGTGTVQTQ